MDNLEKLFNPQSVAIVGVSTSPDKLGSVIFNNLINFGFSGKVFPVNPKYTEINGQICYPTVSSIDEPVDTVCIVVPQSAVKDVVIDCTKKGVKAAIIISAGFGETGQAGEQLESELLEIAKPSGMRILGPNCLGLITPLSKTNISFAASNPKEGNVAFFSQSGAICTALLDMATPINLGFSHFISIGNKIDITENDLVPFFNKDNNVKVIAAYLEEISQGRDLLTLYNSHTNPKPFILLKPGRTSASNKAVQSHTGAMVGERDVFETAMKQSGIISVDSIKSLFNLIKGFSKLNLPRGNRVAVVTNAGGVGVIATDEIISKGLTLAQLSDDSRRKLKESLPVAASTENPVDILGEAPANRYISALQVLIADPNVDIILVLLTPQFVTQIKETSEAVVSLSKTTDKTIVPIYLGYEKIQEGLEIFNNSGIAVYEDLPDALEVLAQMYRFSQWKAKKDEAYQTEKQLQSLSLGKYHNEVSNHTTEAPTALPDELVESICKEVGIPIPPQKLCTSVDECISFSESLYPVVMKIPNSQIMHKSDVKALVLNITNESELRDAYSELTQSGTAKVLVQKQMKAKEELIIGAKRDGNSEVYKNGDGFGHTVLFGKGGIYTETYKDTAQILVPASTEQIVDSVMRTKVIRILSGLRGQPQLALKPLLTTLLAIQKLLILYPEIDNMDLNPLFIDQTDVWAVDVKILVSST